MKSISNRKISASKYMIETIPTSVSSAIDDYHIKYDCIAAGHICLDIIPTIHDSGFKFLPGKLVETGRLSVSTGGSVSNTGICLNQLGIRTMLVGKVGDDILADSVRHVLNTYGVGLAGHLVTAAGEQTSYSIVLSPPGEDRMFLHAPGCNGTFDENDIDYGQVSDARLFHFGYPPLLERTFADEGKSLVSIFRRAKAAGVTTSLDMSLPDRSGPAGKADWPLILKKTLPFVDIFSPNIEELMLMMRPTEYLEKSAGGTIIDTASPALCSALALEMIDLGAKIVVVKLGHRGLFLQTASSLEISGLGRGAPSDLSHWRNRRLWSPCFKVDVAGTTGSGDATIAGFLLGILRGMSPEKCLSAACAVGACCVEAPDSLSGVLSWDETQKRIDSGWPKLIDGGDKNGWNWNERLGLWRGPGDTMP
jgi:sugar/nucleoside kinase (ribokinase family)